MLLAFYVSAGVAIAATALMITRLNVMHALLYLVVSLLAVAIVLFILGAPFVAALEVIIYAGAIMVLFVFVMMLLNLGRRAIRKEHALLKPGAWAGPGILAAILVVQLIYVLSVPAGQAAAVHSVGPKAVALALYGPYLLGVELVSMLLLAGIVGAYHLGWNHPEEREDFDAVESAGQGDAAGGDPVRTRTGGTAGAP